MRRDRKGHETNLVPSGVGRACTVSVLQYTLGDAVMATRLQKAWSRFENSLKVKPVNSIVTHNRFSALSHFSPAVVGETEVDVAKTKA